MNDLNAINDKMFNIKFDKNCWDCGNNCNVLIECKECKYRYCKKCFQECILHFNDPSDCCENKCSNCSKYYKSINGGACFNSLISAIVAGDDRVFLAVSEFSRLNKECNDRYGIPLTVYLSTF